MKRTPIWLVWRLSKNGNNILHVIATSETIANKYRKYIAGAFKDDTIRVYITKTETNHMWAFNLEGEF